MTEIDIDASTDDTHREILSMLPPTLFDFSDLEAGVNGLMAMLTAAPPELPSTVGIDDHHVELDDGHSLLVRTYRHAETTGAAPALYWMHGGGMVLGNVGMDDAHCAAIAEQLGIVVVSVDYRLAPAHPYPTPPEDCYRGLVWCAANADSLGIDPSHIAIGGASAGGGLAAAVALMARDRQGPAIRFQLLRYPMIDDRNTTASSQRVTDGRVWNRSSNLVAWGAYLSGQGGSADVDVYAAPARSADLGGLPPAIVTVGALDMFLDEDIAYASALSAAGVATELHMYPFAFHGSDAMVPHAETSQQMRRDEMSALGRALGVPAS